ISLKVTGKIENFFHNKVLSAGQLFTNNYLSAFSPEFLFIWGDQNSNRHSIHQMGQFYLTEAIFLLGGMVWLLKNGLREKSGKLILMWLLLAPVPSALTRDGATHASRLFLMLPAITIIESQGAVYLWQSLRRNFRQAVFSLIIVLFFFQAVFYFHRYYVHYPMESWRWWHYGFKEAMLFIKENSAKYDTVVINNTYEPALGRFLFWTSYSPALLHEEFPKSLDQPQKQILPGIDAFVIGKKFYFGTTANPGNVSAVLTPGMLYMVSQRDEVGGDWDWRKSPPSGVRVLKTVTNFYDEPIFYLATKSST
ncbi:MAG: hypothetical protein Q8N98_04995, partial [bacterium]|nr:hypothetical protein [bacterium]